MTTPHDLMTDPNVHEPKDITSAGPFQVYEADGAGGGAWKNFYYPLAIELDDVSSVISAWSVGLWQGTIQRIWTIIHGPIITADAVIRFYNDGILITGADITIDQPSSAAGIITSVVPSGDSTADFTAGAVLEARPVGASGNVARLTIVLEIQRTG